MVENWQDLKVKGFTVVRGFFSEEDLSIVRKDYESPTTLIPNENYDVKLAPPDLSIPFEGKLRAVGNAVLSATGIDADVTVVAAHFATQRGISFPWHQDHETFFIFQEHYHHLNFYIPFIKPDPELSNVCLIPFDSLEARSAEFANRLRGGGAKTFVSNGTKTDVLDDEFDTTYVMPFDIEALAVTPKLNAGDLLLMRGDVIHRTQDTSTQRVAVSFRRQSSKTIVRKERLVAGGVRKREWMRKSGPIVELVLRSFADANSNEVNVGQLLPYLLERDAFAASTGAGRSNRASLNAFLHELTERGITLKIEGDRLHVQAPKGAVDEATRARLVQYKGDIIAFLHEKDANAQTIPRLDPTVRGRVSSGQLRMWFMDQLVPNSPLYNLHCGLRIRGLLHQGLLKESLNDVLERHAALRTSFEDGPDEPVQIVQDHIALTLPVRDLSALSESERAHELTVIEREHAAMPFNLRVAPLLRAMLVVLGENEHVLFLAQHHIVSDARSLGIILRDLWSAYAERRSGGVGNLRAPSVTYEEYAAWQRRRLTDASLDQDKAYWQKQLSGIPELLLPADRVGSENFSSGAIVRAQLGEELADALRALGQRHECTLFVTLTALFNVLLARVSDQDDFGTASVVSLRNRPELQDVVGMFVNTVILRCDLSGDPTFAEHLRRTSTTVLDALTHLELPYDRVVALSGKTLGVNASPLGRVALSFYPASNEALSVPELEFSRMLLTEDGGVENVAKFDLVVAISETPNGLVASWQYRTDLFDGKTIQRMSDQFACLAEAVVRDTDKRISELSLLSDEERRRVLVTFNDTGRRYARDVCLADLLTGPAMHAPQSTAVCFEGRELTYSELDIRSNRVAHALREAGVGPNVHVGVFLERSLELPVALFGVLKAGGAFVPLDPELPTKRLEWMLEDAQITVIVTTGHFALRVPSSTAVIVCIDEDALAAAPVSSPPRSARPQDLAYVLFTSGSTGRPKGAIISHASIVNYLMFLQERCRIEPSEAILQRMPIGFDPFVAETFWAAMAGACLVIARPGGHGDAAYLIDLIRERNIAATIVVPSVLRVLLEHEDIACCSQLRHVLCCGEVLTPDLQARFFERLGATGAMLHNVYGPTEAAVNVTHWTCQIGDTRRMVPIGAPVANTQLYVLDRSRQPVPVGVPGELYIGGIQVGNGYVGRPDLTQERFTDDPFGGAMGGRLYATGDLVRWLPDGTLDFMGRRDDQVKLRGQRLELGEIEALFRSHPDVSAAVAIVQKWDDHDSRLVAYVQPRVGRSANPAALAEWLAERLPSTMLPSAIVRLEQLPLTPSGKIDRRALPVPEDVHTSGENAAQYVPPETTTEVWMAELWSRLLHLQRVGAHDDFFRIGGHSLLATRVLAHVRQEFGVRLSMRSLFEAPTLAAFARVLDSARAVVPRDELPPITPHAEDAARILSYSQQRLWFIDRLEPSSPVYNLPFTLRLRGPLDTDALQRALDDVVRRHEVLRSVIVEEDGQPRQLALSASVHPLPVVEVAGVDEPARTAVVQDLIAVELNKPFHLSRGPLLRTTLFRLSPDEHVLTLVMHHAVSDGWSMSIILGELDSAYQAYVSGGMPDLPPLPIQYVDFAIWQRNLLSDDVLERQSQYWKTRLANPVPLDLPLDRPRPAVQRHRGQVVGFDLPRETPPALSELAHSVGATSFIAYLSAFYVLLHRYTGQVDLCIGSWTAGRRHPALEAVVGCFVNTLVLRTDVSGAPTFREVMRRARDVLLAAHAHEDLPFERIVEVMGGTRDLSRAPVFQVMFAFESVATEPRLGRLSCEVLPLGTRSAKFDLSLIITELAGGVTGGFEYDTDLFEPATIERLSRHFVNLVQELVKNPERPISDYDFLGEAEREQLIRGWNDTALDYPRHICLHELIQDQARATPESVAVIDGSTRWTYMELDRRANAMAHALYRRGVVRGDRVAVCVERGAPLIASILGVLKAGAAYVPLDPEYPARRIQMILADTGPRVVVASDGHAHRFSEWEIETVADMQDMALDQLPAVPPQVAVSPEDYAYFIYTSGSTGVPKGIAIVHRSVGNLVAWARGAFDAEELRGVLFSTSICFDMSIFEIFVPLAAGGAMIVAPNALALPSLAAAEEVTLVNTVQSAAVALLQWEGFPRSVRAINLCGEPLSADLVDELYDKTNVERVRDLYGPSECTVYVTGCVRRRRGPVTIGRPIANTQVYVLDATLNLVPTGVIGELYVGGDGIPPGYWERPELTHERFIPDRFRNGAGLKMYRTGDLVRQLSDGTLQFIGRNDHQVKVRGFRIELGEIEAVLRSDTRIRECAVVARADGHSGSILVAYLVKPEAGEVPVDELRRLLSESVPDYMVPSSFVWLDAMPRTVSGKIDRGALPEPVLARDEGAFVAPRTPTEGALSRIWGELLGLDRIGVHDNFFVLGGHSLLVAQLAWRIRKETGADVPLLTVFRNPTLEALAQAIERAHEHVEQAGDQRDADNAWFFIPRPVACPTVRLFCFHPAGTDATVFRNWPDGLAADIEMCGVHLPGRASHPPGSLGQRLDGIIDRFEPLVEPRLDVPFLFFGHSVGALVAFELLRRLERRGHSAVALIVAAYPSPDRRFPVAMSHLSDEGLREALRSIGAMAARELANERLMEATLPLFRADLAIQETYTLPDGAVIDTPIIAFGGDDDSYIKEHELSGWSRFTRASFEVHTFQGGHFFTRSSEESVVAHVARIINGAQVRR